MRNVLLLVAATLAPACATVPVAPWSDADPLRAPQAAPPPGDEVRHISVVLGLREFDDNGLEATDLEKQPVVGFVYDAYPANHGHGYEVGFLSSSDDGHAGGTSVEAEVQELFFGYRKTFLLDRNVHPLFGAGLSILRGDFDFGPSDDDLELAPYVHGGVTVDLGDRLSLGADLRLLFGHFDALGGIDADYVQLAGTLGWRF